MNYDGDDYFLRGVRDRNGHRSGPAITMRCARGHDNQVMGKIFRFASILGWYKRGYVDIGRYVTSTHAILYSEPNSQASLIAGEPHGSDCNYLPLIRDERTRRALAFWREGARLRNIHTGYAFLSFFKVIESQFDKSAARVAWIASALPALTGDAADRVKELSAQVADVGKHIYESGRSAIAHAQYADGRGDPDVPEDRARLMHELVMIEALARKYIADELQVPDEMQVYRSRDRLKPLAPFVPESVRQVLQSKGHVSRRHVGLQGLEVGLAHWPRPPIPAFSRLSVRVREVRCGWVFASATSAAGSISLGFGLDFPSGRAHLDIDESRYQSPTDAKSLEEAIAVIEFRKQVIGNGRMELWLPDGGRVDFEVVLPVNIDIAGTWRNMDAQINELRQHFGKSDARPDH